MAGWRISKDRAEWAIVPELPWTVAEWDGQESCWVRRQFPTWREAVEWLCAAWPVLEPDSGIA